MRRKVLKGVTSRPSPREEGIHLTSPLATEISSPHTGTTPPPGTPSGKPAKPGTVPVLTRISNDNATYQLGAELGRGGFGAVFQALNVDTGDFVAVKRIELTDVDNDNLSSIQLEIDLLKKLNHPNIVKYIDSIRTEHHLHIILEFMENGSLATVCKKFGNFSESLAAIYMTQVLQGLQYLHEQGVLHRDIKGANILTTKEGLVKLADFGVALKVNESKSSELDVVGSPYWMAPEIIEMNAPTSACDIWSLGCTIVELLSGKPPYFDLAAMAALFRIVQDDYPPLPEGISEALRDFLLQCFKKEPLFRKSASELLKHPWLKNPRNHLDRVKQNNQLPQMIPSLCEPQVESPEPEQESVVNTIRMYAQGATFVANDNDQSDENSGEKEATRKLGAWKDLLKNMPKQDESTEDWDSPGSDSTNDTSTIALGKNATAAGLLPDRQQGNHVVAPPLKISKPSSVGDDENWDDDFVEVDTSGGKRADPPKGAASSSGNEMKPNVLKLPAAPSTPTVALGGELDDLVIGDDDEDSNFQSRRRSVTTTSGPKMPRKKAQSMDKGGSANVEHAAILAGTTAATLDRYRETGDEGDDFDDLDLDLGPHESLEKRINEGPTGLVATAAREEDTANVHDDAIFLDDQDMEHQGDKGVHLRRAAEVSKLVEQVKSDSKEKTIREVCAKLMEMFEQYPEQPALLVAQHGVIPIMQMLEVRTSAALPSVLAVINRIIDGDAKMQEHLSFLGFIPIIIKFIGSMPVVNETPTHSTSGFLSGGFFGGSSSHKRESSSFTSLSSSPDASPRPISLLRVEAAKCVYQICTTSKLCLQMFIGCGGLSVLVDLVASAEDSSRSPEAKKLVLIGIDCLIQIFTHLDIRRNDCCRLLVKLGLLPHLSVAFLHMLNSIAWGRDCEGDQYQRVVFSAETWQHIEKIADILSYFSRADPVVKSSMAHESVLQALVRVFSPPSSAILDLPPYANLVVNLLKCVKNISFQENTLDKLDAANFIKILVPLADRRGHIMDKDIENQVLHCMYNLCRVNKKRQEKAAIAGIVPLLQRCYKERSHMKEIALTVVCDLAHTSDATREELWSNHGVDFYLGLLQENYWQVPALNSLSVWLSYDVKRVESVLVRPNSVESLVGLIRSAQGKTFEQISGPVLDMMSKSVLLRKTLGISPAFVTALLVKLQNPKAIVRKPVLTLLKIIYQHHDRKGQFIADYDLYPTIRALAQDNSQVLVKDLATQLLHDFDKHKGGRS